MSRPPKVKSQGQTSGVGLKERTWKRFLTGPDPVLLEELYIPGLAASLHYDRCCAYFSSSVLSAAARGFGKMIEHLIALGKKAPRPAVRLIVNEEMQAEDVRVMIETGDTRRLEEALLKRFKNPKDVLEKQRLKMLGWMVKTGLLDIRIGVMRRGTGIVHAKYGIMRDEAGEAVVFSGSGNETAQGLLANYEQLEISTSWDDPARLEHYRKEFDLLWSDSHADVHTVTLPEAVRLKLIKFAPKEPPIQEPSNALARQKAAMLWQYIMESPYFPDGGATCDATAMVDIWPHQRRVVEEVSAAWPYGRLLCDEVGMGKTIEAIMVLRRLLAGRGVKRALLLVPAGLLKQWQAELREKGGLLIPRLEGLDNLFWPDERREKVQDLAEALKEDVLLMSRETARTERNVAILLSSEPWDLVLLDEAHAARRKKQEEGEFNTGNLLLNLLRQLQLRRKARGFLLLSATPMQTHPWEPWDLLGVLGEGGEWLADFANVRHYYNTIRALKEGLCSHELAEATARLIIEDDNFPDQNGQKGTLTDISALAAQIEFASSTERETMTSWLRRSSPLARRMHRNSRSTLRHYYEKGLLETPPPRRKVIDIEYEHKDTREREIYDDIAKYIHKRFRELEVEKKGKGFVMTIYQRRASSSPHALKESLKRRRDGLNLVINHKAYSPDADRQDQPEGFIIDDIPDGEMGNKISTAYPEDPGKARQEREEVENLLDKLEALGSTDSKRDMFCDILKNITQDGRPVLVFTEYVDTMIYLRETLVDYYQGRLGCYSGEGGRIWEGNEWKTVTKDFITRALREGSLTILLCTDAASEGLNLQAAGALINYDLPWNPSRVEQRIGRIDRIGQRYEEIFINNFFLKDSVDERVYKVLRERCRLFEDFVGAMQPVLSLAQRFLLGEITPDLDELIAQAEKLEQDPVIQELFIDDDINETPDRKNAVSRQDLIHAIEILQGEFGLRIANNKNNFSTVQGMGSKLRVGFTVESLEANRDVLPLSIIHSPLLKIVEFLLHSGEQLPLVIGSSQEGPFRCSIAYWVGKNGIKEMNSVKQLSENIQSWDGVYPEPDECRKAEERAKKEAKRHVQKMLIEAQEKEEYSFWKQLQACKLRLLKEIGRFLICMENATTDIDGMFGRHLSREGATSRRLQKCLDMLGKNPEWTSNQHTDLVNFYHNLNEGQKSARRLGSEIDGALDDPRWVVQHPCP